MKNLDQITLPHFTLSKGLSQAVQQDMNPGSGETTSQGSSRSASSLLTKFSTIVTSLGDFTNSSHTKAGDTRKDLKFGKGTFTFVRGHGDLSAALKKGSSRALLIGDGKTVMCRIGKDGKVSPNESVRIFLEDGTKLKGKISANGELNGKGYVRTAAGTVVNGIFKDGRFQPEGKQSKPAKLLLDKSSAADSDSDSGSENGIYGAVGQHRAGAAGGGTPPPRGAGGDDIYAEVNKGKKGKKAQGGDQTPPRPHRGGGDTPPPPVPHRGARGAGGGDTPPIVHGAPDTIYSDVKTVGGGAGKQPLLPPKKPVPLAKPAVPAKPELGARPKVQPGGDTDLQYTEIAGFQRRPPKKNKPATELALHPQPTRKNELEVDKTKLTGPKKDPSKEQLEMLASLKYQALNGLGAARDKDLDGFAFIMVGDPKNPRPLTSKEQWLAWETARNLYNSPVANGPAVAIKMLARVSGSEEKGPLGNDAKGFPFRDEHMGGKNPRYTGERRKTPDGMSRYPHGFGVMQDHGNDVHTFAYGCFNSHGRLEGPGTVVTNRGIIVRGIFTNGDLPEGAVVTDRNGEIFLSTTVEVNPLSGSIYTAGVKDLKTGDPYRMNGNRDGFEPQEDNTTDF